MLSTRFEYTLNSNEQGCFELRIAPAPDEASMNLTVVHNDTVVPGDVVLRGYTLWSESGYALMARSVRAAALQLRELTGPAEVAKLAISINGSPSNSSERHEVSSITFMASRDGGSVQVTGPVLRAGFTARCDDSGRDVVEVTTKIFEFCAITPVDYDSFPCPRLTHRYSGGIGEDFIFVEELPFEVCSWFVAFVKAFKKKSIYREGTVAHYRTWQAFVRGEI